MNWRNSQSRIIGAAFILICGILLPHSPVKANYFDDFYRGVEQFSGLPSEVNRLKESYKETLDDLDQARADAQAYQEQNEQLMQQNRQLAETVQELQQTNQARKAKETKLKITLITVVLLAIGYFVLIRVLRFVMRRSNNRI